MLSLLHIYYYRYIPICNTTRNATSKLIVQNALDYSSQPHSLQVVEEDCNKVCAKNFREQLYLVFSRFCLQQSAGGSQFRVHSFRIYQRSVPIKNETPSLQGMCSKRGGGYVSEMNAVQGVGFPAPSSGNYRSGDISGHH